MPLPTAGQQGTLTTGKSLAAGQALSAQGGYDRLTYQGDGNLVLSSHGSPVWASNTSGSTTGSAIMQADGNFVVRNAGGTPIWSTQTSGNPGAYVAIAYQSNPMFAIRSSSGQVLWSTLSGF